MRKTTISGSKKVANSKLFSLEIVHFLRVNLFLSLVFSTFLWIFCCFFFSSCKRSSYRFYSFYLLADTIQLTIFLFSFFFLTGKKHVFSIYVGKLMINIYYNIFSCRSIYAASTRDEFNLLKKHERRKRGKRSTSFLSQLFNNSKLLSAQHREEVEKRNEKLIQFKNYFTVYCCKIILLISRILTFNFLKVSL